MRRTAGGYDDGLRAEDVVVPVTDVETDGASDPVGFRVVHQQVGHHDPVVDFGGGLAGGLRDDRLVTFAVNHDLPFALALVPPGFRVPHHGETPLLELVNCGVHVAGDIVAQILPHQTHEVVPGVADMVLWLVLVPLHAHVAVDRVKALRDGAAALDVRLLDAHNLQVAPPIPGFVCGPAASHAAADDEDIRIHEHRFFSACEQAHYTKPCLN